MTFFVSFLNEMFIKCLIEHFQQEWKYNNKTKRYSENYLQFKKKSEINQIV